MSVAVRIRPLTRWSLARRFISVASVSEWVSTRRRATRTEGDHTLENEHCGWENMIKTSTVPLEFRVHLQ